MKAYRRPFEVAVVVHRPGESGREYLVLLRSPDQHGYWHLVAGGIEWGEEPDVAAARELREETGLEAPVHVLALGLSYSLAEEPEVLRTRFPPHTERIEVASFRAAAPAGWEPTLDHEHVEYRWCDLEAAVGLLRYPEPREAVRAAHGALEGGG